MGSVLRTMVRSMVWRMGWCVLVALLDLVKEIVVVLLSVLVVELVVITWLALYPGVLYLVGNQSTLGCSLVLDTTETG